MEPEIIIIYVLCEELTKAMGIREDSRCKMSNAEVMTVVVVAARYFGGHFGNAQQFLSEHHYIPDMLSESRLNRRIHATDDSVRENMFCILSETFKKSNASGEYTVDSFPIPVCDNIRISRSEIFNGEEYRGYMAGKRRYFFGLRVHMIITADGKPVGFLLVPGSEADVRILRGFDLNIPENPIVYADKSYNDYRFEDMLREAAGIILSPIRKKNSVRATDSYIERPARQCTGKNIETTFSRITNFFPKKIHAVTSKCFCIKVIAFIISFSIQLLIQ